MSFRKFLYLFSLLYFVSFLMWPYYIDLRLTEHFGLNPQRLLIMVILPTFVLYIIACSSLSFERLIFRAKKYKRLYYLISWYLFSRIISIFFSENSAYSALIVINEFANIAFLYAFILLTISEKDDLKKLLDIIYWTGIVASIYVIFEYAFENNILINFADSSTKAGEIALDEKYRDGIYRAQGFFEHPITQSQVLVSVLLFSYFFISKKSFLFGSPIYLMAIYFTGSRFGFLVAILFLLTITLNKLRKISLLLRIPIYFFMLILPVYFILDSLVFSASQSELSSSLTRVAQLYAGFNAFIDSPIFGHGPGYSSETLFKFTPEAGDFVLYRPSADNYFLSILVDSGLAALLPLLLILFFTSDEFSNCGIKGWLKYIPLLSFSSLLILSIFHAVYFIIFFPLLVCSYLAPCQKPPRSLHSNIITSGVCQ